MHDGKTILSDLLSSQMDLHNQYGGVVPELACRRHIEMIGPLVRRALEKAACSIDQIDAVAVTVGPGLIGALLVGVSFAKALSYARKIPLLPVHHLEGHISATYIEYPEIVYPSIALVVSGGHTSLYYVARRGEYRLLGKTIDDAAGEILDKGARMLGYGYPGGPIIDRLAQEGDPEKVRFPRPYRSSSHYNFSFSGLKTAFMQTVHQVGRNGGSHADIAAGYQAAIVDSLVEKSLLAVEKEEAKSIMLVGGVAANSLLRKRVKESGDRLGIKTYIPAVRYCTDNAAMIAMAGISHYERGHFGSFNLNPQPNLELAL